MIVMTIGKSLLLFLGLAILTPKGLGEEKKEKDNFSFGKVQDLEISLSPVPDSVGSGGKPAVILADGKASQDGRWLRIDVPFQTKKKVTPELKFNVYLEGYEVLEGEGGAKTTEKFVVLGGEAAFTNIPKGDKHFVALFLSPGGVTRFSGTKPNGENDWSEKKLNLRVEATEGGAPIEGFFDLMAEKEKGPSGRGGKKDPDWHKNPEAQQMPGVLLPIQETPFWPKDYKRYPQPKKL